MPMPSDGNDLQQQMNDFNRFLARAQEMLQGTELAPPEVPLGKVDNARWVR